MQFVSLDNAVMTKSIAIVARANFIVYIEKECFRLGLGKILCVISCLFIIIMYKMNKKWLIFLSIFKYHGHKINNKLIGYFSNLGRNVLKGVMVFNYERYVSINMSV